MPTENRHFPRSSGILLHPTCLPGPDGIGDLGECAFRFVDWLERTGQSLWQILPLGPTGYGDSPYQTLSTFAGNPLLISLDRLVRDGRLTAADLAGRPRFPADRVDFGRVIEWKLDRLEAAWERCAGRPGGEFAAWCAAEAAWLEDYVLFAALKEELAGLPWTGWPAELVRREPAALAAARERLADRLAAHRFRQFLFAEQWQQLRAFAAARGVRLLGDLPIFVAHDSSDVWANQELFRLDAAGKPTHVAGVPPDYFSATGQLWGNPLYDWDRLAATDYRWWIDRLRQALEQADLVRIDHFRGFEAFWEIPAAAETAQVGRWVRGPGEDFFTALQAALGTDLPLVAEDLGVITAQVVALRDRFDLPGMKVLQFAWSGPDNGFLPHEHPRHCLVYTGTHDNDPVCGWWDHLATAAEQQLAEEYFGCPLTEPNWALIRLGQMSCAHTFIAPLQDVLGLGREGRMNLPGADSGNWDWRMPADAFTHPGAERLARLTWLTRRRPDQVPRPADIAEDPEALDTPEAEP